MYAHKHNSETLYEDEKFQNRALAAVVASKVFYHLEDLDDALKYALGAGDLFDVTQTTQYVQTLVSKCIDEYISLRKAGKDDIDQRLVSVVERMFERCFDAAKYKQALGIAIESQRSVTVYYLFVLDVYASE